MFKNVNKNMGIEGVQVCRLCLAEEEDLINIFDPNGYQGLHLWEIIEELIQMEVSKKDGLPWTICEECISKVKEFKHFKTTCIKAKISFLTMIANRGLVSSLATNAPSWVSQEPTKAIQKRGSGETSRKDSVEVVVAMKEETPVLSEDEDPLREITVVRREEDHGEKVDGCSMTGGSPKMCEKLVSHLRDDKKQNITKKFEGNTGLSGLPGKYSLGNMRRLSAVIEDSLNSGHNITSALEFSDMMSYEQKNLDSHKTQLVACTVLICDYCGVKFTDKKKLVIHIRCHISRNSLSTRIMPEKTVIKCSESRVTGVKSSKPFKCDTCGQGFSHKSSLVKHSVIHSGLKAFKCDKCGKRFTRNCNLVKHLDTHSGLKAFKCDTCGKRFTQKYHLVKHLDTHSGLRAFKCDTCGKEFTQKYHLVTHFDTHSGLRAFKCATCGKEFAQKSSLVAHSVIHSGFKAFKCDTCGKRFHWRVELRRHSIIHLQLKGI